MENLNLEDKDGVDSVMNDDHESIDQVDIIERWECAMLKENLIALEKPYTAIIFFYNISDCCLCGIMCMWNLFSVCASV